MLGTTIDWLLKLTGLSLLESDGLDVLLLNMELSLLLLEWIRVHILDLLVCLGCPSSLLEVLVITDLAPFELQFKPRAQLNKIGALETVVIKEQLRFISD